MNRNLIIAIDIGNTTTSIGVVDCDAVRCFKKQRIPTIECEFEIERILKEIGQEFSNDNVPVSISIVGAVQRDTLFSVDSLRKPGRVTTVAFSKDIPVHVSYKNPASLGADRLANTVFCAQRYLSKDVIIIDAGTTITVDLVSAAGTFCGGAILPGIAMQSEALSTKTAQLPLSEPGSEKISFPGRDTAGCIQAGIFASAMGGIEFLVKSYKEHMMDDCIVAATGGGWPLLARYCSFDVDFVEDATVIGVGMFGYLMRQR